MSLSIGSTTSSATANAKPHSPCTVSGWLAAIRKGEADPQRVISECTLPDEAFDNVLLAAYEKQGGVPQGV